MAWSERGDPAGHPVVYCHGFPGSRLEVEIAATAAARAGVRLIAPDRPGFGHSSPGGDQRLHEWPADLAQLLDALEIERCGIFGMSGGGPYALASGARLGPRIDVIALVSGLGPLDAPGARDGMAPFNRASIHLAQHHPWVQAGLFHVLGAVLRHTPAAVQSLMRAGEAGPDRSVLDQPGVAKALRAGMRGNVRQGAGAAIDELRSYVAPWPFALDQITTRVLLWHGEADTVVPPSHARTLAARLPDAHITLLPGEGHFSVPIRHGDAIFEASHGCTERSGLRSRVKGTRRPRQGSL